MRQFIKIFLMLLVAVLPNAANAYLFNDGILTYRTNGDGSVTVVHPYLNMSYGSYALEIPNSVQSYSVTKIGEKAFSDCKGLTSVTIPNSVTEIGSQAFAVCSGLTSVTIGSSVTTIGENAFTGCSSLTSITVDEANTTYDSRENCKGIIRTADNTLVVGCKSTIIPNSVSSIGSQAFAGCSGLTSITIPNSVTKIGNAAFINCNGLTSVTIPNSVSSIGSQAFAGCSGLTSVTIPNSVTEIGSQAFAVCSGLTSVTIGSSVTTIGENAFTGCSSLTSITVDEANTTYDSRENCKGIIRTADNTLVVGCKSTIIPNSVSSIGSQAFAGCSGLTSITIPNSVTKIGNAAFINCNGLTSIVIPESVTNLGEDDDSFYRKVNGNVIEPPQEGYGFGVFYCCTNLIDVKIYGQIRYLEEDTFRGCVKLATVELPSSLESVGSLVFYGCKALTSVTCNASQPPIYDGWTSWVITTGNQTSSGVDWGGLSKNPYHTFYGLNMSKIELNVPAQSVQAYKEAELWENFKVLPLENGIEEVKNNVELKIEGYYDIQGRRFDNPISGINIVRYSDGTTKKIIEN